MLNKEEGLKAIERLLDGGDASPRRYLAVGYLMQADLDALSPRSTTSPGGWKTSSGGRPGRAGPKFRKVEDGVIESLDKMIKKIEEQQKAAAATTAATFAPNEQVRPRSSRPMGGKGPGEVTKRVSASKSGWGDCLQRSAKSAAAHRPRVSRRTIAHRRTILSPPGHGRRQ